MTSHETFDTTNLFHLNQNIKPLATTGA